MLIVAHRGAHHPESPGVRENTVEAFRAAAATGAAGVELDVRATADGALVVLHDPGIEGAGPVAAAAAQDLPAWLPTLAEALDVCGGLAFVDVEVKVADPRIACAVAEAIEGSPVSAHAVVTSFHLAAIDAVHAAASVPTGWLTLPGYDQLQALEEAARRGHRFLAPADAATDARLVAAAHDAGLQLVVWTVDDPRRVRELRTWGVDVCVTDRPRRAAAALA